MAELEAAKLLESAVKQLKQVSNLAELDALRVAYLGKSGSFTLLLKNLATIPPEDRKSFGQAVNSAKQELQAAIATAKDELTSKQLAAKLAADKLDSDLDPSGMSFGSLHPVTQTRYRIEEIFGKLGFSIEHGPEIEDEEHNFVALNIPEHHPARAMQDTFYMPGGLLLRTHTSPVQIRTMRAGKPPFKIISTGRVYRCDFDVSHTPMFHQVEGLMIDENINMGHLRGVLLGFLSTLFEQDVKLRMRPSYFPFTEPSAEVDMSCVACQGRGCRICKQTGWVEILGCGMVHPKVLANCNIDSDKYSGWAFGVGIDRLAMLRYGVDDLRKLFENDSRFLAQF